jgi:hypothetical protein
MARRITKNTTVDPDVVAQTVARVGKGGYSREVERLLRRENEAPEPKAAESGERVAT